MKSKMRFIMATCWVAILADFLWAVGLFFPTVFISLTGRGELKLDLQLRLIMMVAGSLMLGWTFLLYWASQRPLERRFVFLLTALPVVCGIFIATCISVYYGNSFSIWIGIKTFLIFIAMLTSYFLASAMNQKQKPE